MSHSGNIMSASYCYLHCSLTTPVITGSQSLTPAAAAPLVAAPAADALEAVRVLCRGSVSWGAGLWQGRVPRTVADGLTRAGLLHLRLVPHQLPQIREVADHLGGPVLPQT